MAGLTTHVLDTAQGRPAAGVRVRLYGAGGDHELLREATTNAHGRLDQPLLAPGEVKVGRYRLVFDIGAYFAGSSLTLADPPFLDEVTIAFAIAEPGAHYHVPLLVAPWGYTTYRGS
ncbi:MAG: hydroxyisourate hydrolase [Gammaproteobacteria bacterium]|nr:hydroxyisourate hydrolase [Gammaproteobacteria bacterium]